MENDSPHHMSERAQIVWTGSTIPGHNGRLQKLEHPSVAGKDGHGGQSCFHIVQETVLILVDLKITQRFTERNVTDGVNAKVAGQITPVHGLGAALGC